MERVEFKRTFPTEEIMKEWLRKAPPGYYGCEVYLSGYSELYKFKREYVNAHKETAFRDDDSTFLRIEGTVVSVGREVRN